MNQEGSETAARRSLTAEDVRQRLSHYDQQLGEQIAIAKTRRDEAEAAERLADEMRGAIKSHVALLKLLEGEPEQAAGGGS